MYQDGLPRPGKRAGSLHMCVDSNLANIGSPRASRCRDKGAVKGESTNNRASLRDSDRLAECGSEAHGMMQSHHSAPPIGQLENVPRIVTEVGRSHVLTHTHIAHPTGQRLVFQVQLRAPPFTLFSFPQGFPTNR
jgi:hypothetical protein